MRVCSPFWLAPTLADLGRGRLTSSQGVCNGQAVCACLNVNAPFTIPRTKDGSVDCKFDSLPTSTACPGNEKPQSSNDAASSDVEPGPNPFPVQSCSVQNPRSAVYVCSCRSRFLGALPMFSILTPGQACGTTAAPESCISPYVQTLLVASFSLLHISAIPYPIILKIRRAAKYPY